MPLSIPEGASGEPPEVKELKNRVRQVAKRYVENDSLLCETVYTALEEAGISPKTEKVKVTAELLLKFSAPLEIDPDEFAGLTPEQERTKLAEMLNQLGSVQINWTDVHQLSVMDVNPRQVQKDISDFRKYDVPQGYRCAWTSSEGRVAHLVRVIDPARNSLATFSLCNTNASRFEWYVGQTSPQQNHVRVCKSCAKQDPDVR